MPIAVAGLVRGTAMRARDRGIERRARGLLRVDRELDAREDQQRCAQRGET